ncbi:hypothetical protein RJ640_004604 [Escallonia rubra]|uniref:Glabrous enhancer-binding protein-like DBD domain-containing protein n=1 Tax=Escallonia rubra TaxID=112253 RepID=A0AA88UH55_9ASTE|nr:hypothetical protein RJ640_004604 [Escallonia rubra]
MPGNPKSPAAPSPSSSSPSKQTGKAIHQIERREEAVGKNQEPKKLELEYQGVQSAQETGAKQEEGGKKGVSMPHLPAIVEIPSWYENPTTVSHNVRRCLSPGRRAAYAHFGLLTSSDDEDEEAISEELASPAIVSHNVRCSLSPGRRAVYAHFGLLTSSDDEDEEAISEEFASPAILPYLPQKPSQIKISEQNEGFLFDKSQTEKEDEITLSKFVLLYQSSNLINNPFATDFVLPLHDFIKNSLKVNISATLLREKIKKLQKKFTKTTEEKGEKNPQLLIPHDQEQFEMLKNVWRSKSSNHQDDEQMRELRVGQESGDGLGHYPFLKESLDFADNGVLRGRVAAGLGLIEESKRVELNDKWRQWKEKELELKLEQVGLLGKQTILALQALKSEDGHDQDSS